MTEEDAVMVDAMLEAGAKLEVWDAPWVSRAGNSFKAGKKANWILCIEDFANGDGLAPGPRTRLCYVARELMGDSYEKVGSLPVHTDKYEDIV